MAATVETGSHEQVVTRRGTFRYGAGLVGALAAVSAAACGPLGGPSKPAAKISGTLIYRDWRLNPGQAVDEAFYKAVKDGFTAKHPDVKIEQEQVSWGEYIEKFLASVAADSASDVQHTSVIMGRDWWSAGALEDLGPYVARTPAVAPKQYLEAALFYNSWKGKTFGVPHVGPDMQVFYVNRKLLREAGIDPSDEALAKWTWQDLVAHNQKLTRRDGDKVTRAGLWFSAGASLEDFTTWLYANGGQFYNKDRSGVAFNTAQGQQVLEFFLDWRTKHRGHQLPDGVNSLAALPEGAAVGVRLGSWNQRNILPHPQTPNLDYTMVNIPRGPSGKQQATTAWSNMNTMTKASKHKELAWAFVEHYSSLPVAIQQFDIWKQVSPRKDFLESDAWKQAAQRAPSYAPFRKIAETGDSYAYIKFADVNEKLAPLLREAYVDSKRSVRDALAEMERQANLILSQVK